MFFFFLLEIYRVFEITNHASVRHCIKKQTNIYMKMKNSEQDRPQPEKQYGSKHLIYIFPSRSPYSCANNDCCGSNCTTGIMTGCKHRSTVLLLCSKAESWGFYLNKSVFWGGGYRVNLFLSELWLNLFLLHRIETYVGGKKS